MSRDTAYPAEDAARADRLEAEVAALRDELDRVRAVLAGVAAALATLSRSATPVD